MATPYRPKQGEKETPGDCSKCPFRRRVGNKFHGQKLPGGGKCIRPNGNCKDHPEPIPAPALPCLDWNLLATAKAEARQRGIRDWLKLLPKGGTA